MRIHLSQSVRGALRNWTKREWRNNAKCMTVNGEHVSGEELKEAFFDMLAEGNEMLPIGDCDNFDPKKGCLGHGKAQP